MINLDNITNKNNKEHNEKCPDHPYRILMIGSSGSGKTSALINLINEPDDIAKIYLYAKDLSKPKYEILIKNCENVGKSILMIQTHLSSVQIQWITFMKILMIITQAEKEECWLLLMT